MSINSAAAESHAPQTARLTVLDNTKGLLIFLVVFGHLVERLTGDGGIVKSVYLSVYSIHMPAFALLAGMTTRGPFDKVYFRRLAGTVLVPFIVFTIFYELLEFAMRGTISDYTKLAQPYWLLWFLLSLCCWRGVLPLAIKVPGILGVALVVSLAAGYFDPSTTF